MKIHALPPAIAPKRPAPPAAPPAQTFQSFLGSAGQPGRETDSHAESFAEAGLLDAEGAGETTANETPPPHLQQRDVRDLRQTQERLPPEALSSRLSESSRQNATDLLGAGPRMALNLSEPTASSASTLLSVSTTRSATTSSPRTAQADGSASSGPLRRTPPPPSAQVSVTVAEADGTLQIMAAAPGLNQGAGSRLRKIMADLAAQFGLRLGELHMNGAPVSPPPTGSIGAPHGR